MTTYNSYMLEEENHRLKSLLTATTIFYVFGGGLSLWFAKFLYSDAFIVWTIGRPWTLWVTWFVLFLSYSWIPLTFFLLIQGILLKRKYSEVSYTGDRTVGNLSVVVPLVFISIYIFTRVVY